jgi:hypothetical protein
VVVFQWPCGIAARHRSPRGARPQARHLGAGAGLVDEDESCRIELGLRLEPGQPTRLHVRALLLGGMRRLFFSVMRRRSKKRQSVLTATRTPRSRHSASRSSASVTSGVAATRASRSSHISGGTVEYVVNTIRMREMFGEEEIEEEALRDSE